MPIPENVQRRISSRLVFDSRYDGQLMEKFTAAPDSVVHSAGQILKHDRTTTVAKIDDDGVAWVVKRYNTKNIWHAIRRTLRRSRALNCWEMSGHFIAAGIPIPAPVGYMEKRFGPLRGRSYFLYEYVDAQDLLSYMKAGKDPGGFDIVMQELTALFRTLRTAGINHGDMKATNILVEADGNLKLLDLDAARKTGHTEAFELGYTRDRARFLKNWQNDPDLQERFDSALPR